MGTLVRLKKFADLLKKKIYILEDCAESLGSAYKKKKTIGDIWRYWNF